MPNFKSISFKMAVLRGGGADRRNLPPPYVCYPKDPMWNRVKNVISFEVNVAPDIKVQSNKDNLAKYTVKVQ